MAGIPRLALCPGEPAGVGPDLLLGLAQALPATELVAIADPGLLDRRAAQLGLEPPRRRYDASAEPRPGLCLLPQPLATHPAPGQPDAANAGALLQALDRAVDGCRTGEFAAMVTGPLDKAVISRGGHSFSGHTGYLAERCGHVPVLMLLCADDLRVALLTTHLPLAAVPAALTPERLRTAIGLLHDGLRRRFGIAAPRIMVLGLNPHAGERGLLGREEIDVIAPVLAELRAAGHDLTGPLPADTAFVPATLRGHDAVLAMYHDQGLPVLKREAFDRAVNVTLGLPIVRTSVDHGTAYDLAGTGRADGGSLRAAIDLALELARPA